MAPHSSTFAWQIPWTEEPGGLQSMGLLGVGHDWATSLSLVTFMHRRRKWQPIPVFLPGESQGRGSPVGCRLWGHTESDPTEVTEQQQQQPAHATRNIACPSSHLAFINIIVTSTNISDRKKGDRSLGQLCKLFKIPRLSAHWEQGPPLLAGCLYLNYQQIVGAE